MNVYAATEFFGVLAIIALHGLALQKERRACCHAREVFGEILYCGIR